MMLPDADALFVWPADHPAVDPATLARLLDRAARDAALLPVHAGRRIAQTRFARSRSTIRA
jgi:CTP:molybdopterin cytidylyltransferase MocA